MRMLRVLVLMSVCMLIACNTIDAQRLDIKGVRKRSRVTDCATIIFKSPFDSLTITGTSKDSIYKEKNCEYDNVWTQSVDLKKEREQDSVGVINRSFILHTPYTEDVELTVPGKDRGLKQSIYEYNVRVIDYFPLRLAFELDLIRIRDYFGVRVSAGEKFGGYLSAKLGLYNKEGFNADERSNVDLSKKTYQGRIRNSYMAGFKYGILSRDFPLYGYFGIGYGDSGIQRSNGEKGKKRVAYYNDYTRGFESEIGVNMIFMDFISISFGADVIFGHRVAFDMNCTIGMVVDLTQ